MLLVFRDDAVKPPSLPGLRRIFKMRACVEEDKAAFVLMYGLYLYNKVRSDIEKVKGTPSTCEHFMEISPKINKN